MILVLACFVVAANGCCVPAEVKAKIKTEYRINAAHAADASLPEHSRLIGADNADAWAAVDYSLTGTPLPEDVEARLRVRGQLPEGYDE